MAEPGDIVRVWSINGEAKFDPCFGVVVTDPAIFQDHYWDITAYVFDPPERPLARKSTNGGDIGWYFKSGEYEVVPEAEVPDDIWVALAKWALTQ